MVEVVQAIRTMKSWEETTTHQVAGGPKITRSLVAYSHEGAIAGDSFLDYSMVYVSSTSTMFVGYEQVDGSVGGRSGTFVLCHEGKFQDGVASIEVTVVPGTGTGDLAKISGKGKIVANSTDPMKSMIELQVDFV
jgi:hypothetical protein